MYIYVRNKEKKKKKNYRKIRTRISFSKQITFGNRLFVINPNSNIPREMIIKANTNWISEIQNTNIPKRTDFRGKKRGKIIVLQIVKRIKKKMREIGRNRTSTVGLPRLSKICLALMN